MDKESTVAAKVEEPVARITRARAKALGTSGGIPPPVPKPYLKEDQKRALRANTKRTASDDNKSFITAVSGLQHKRRAVLKDVTNLKSESSNASCTNVTKVQDMDVKPARKCHAKKNMEMVDISMETSEAEEDIKARLAEELSKIRMVESQEITSPTRQKGICHHIKNGCAADSLLTPRVTDELQSPQSKQENIFCKKLESSSGQVIADIDSNLKDPQICGLYAPEIYSNRRVKELDQRPSTNYMEKLQHDITPSMRGILIDWLVEVSEEYRLVPDTLYLTVNLIDRFLSENFIEKQRLQLLGVTCMLIASKYEEICAPRVEEFCFITDNTYTRREVLKMERQVLNLLYFQISVPTTKTFLRRFIQAAQASYKAPCIELEFLANYLAELTLVEYDFLKILPSLIAASAVFLARWTLDQSDHPWNPTLEHYTSYNASELKTTVLALEDLQLNTNGCPLNAIREKYRQQKLKSVANMTSTQRVLSLFER
ncbi:cyclin-A2-1-like isoform X2 [Mercurialis annua]|uniref:cyclin-A2-1-like isoform X2 n=1 Tax=Mercurialis annua TaxID=3986 RepID=UPI00215E863D|nr:cyclin-A2-1-like isoform X2 [Mercurialis annua]